MTVKGVLKVFAGAVLGGALHSLSAGYNHNSFDVARMTAKNDANEVIDAAQKLVGSGLSALKVGVARL